MIDLSNILIFSDKIISINKMKCMKSLIFQPGDKLMTVKPNFEHFQ